MRPPAIPVWCRPDGEVGDAARELRLFSGKDAIHCADRALVYAFIEQRRVDFRRRQIGKSGATAADRARFAAAPPALCAAGSGALSAGQAGCDRRRTLRCRLAREMPSAAQLAEMGARRRQRGGERLGQAALLGPMSGGTGGSSSPSRSASFFWSSMIASARSRRRRSCAFSRVGRCKFG